MRGNEVRDQVLLLTCLKAVLIEHAFEAVIGANTGLHHFRQRLAFGMLRGDLEVATDVMRHQLFNVFRTLNSEVIT